MNDFKGLLVGMFVVAILYLLNRILPKWFGPIPGIVFLIFMIYLITIKQVNLLQGVIILLAGESVLNSIWFSSFEAKKEKNRKNIEKMKAKDLSNNYNDK